MNTKNLLISWARGGCFGLGAVLCLLSPASLPGQQSDVEQLRKEMREMQSRFEEAQRAHQREMEALSRKLEELTRQQAAQAEVRKVESELTAEAAPAPPAGPPGTSPKTDPAAARSLASPIRLGTDKSFVDVSLIGTFAAGGSTADDIAGGTQLGGHDPNQRGFTVQGVELSLNGAVDPYFRGAANILYSLDADGESFLELEEAWMETLNLPWNLQLRAGQLMTDFGRQNTQHPHQWGFVDTPLALGRYLGPDGLRNPGARLSWLTPTPFYSELMLSVQNSQGETAASFRSGGDDHGHGDEPELPLAYRHAENDRGVSSFGDLLFTPRYVTSFDLTDTQVLLLGGSAAFGPNASGEPGAGDTVTQIYGLDLTWKWTSPNQHAGFPFVSFQTEGLLRRYEAGAFDWDENGNGLADDGEILDEATGGPAFLKGETLVDYGFYSQVLYGFHRGWVAGLRFDYLTSDQADYESRPLSLDGERLGRDPQRDQRWRLSPNLTWYPSEFSKVRLQYNYDDRRGIGTDHSVWLQFEFLLGAHGAHKF